MNYSKQAKQDFEMWSILEKAGLLPPPHRLPSRRLIKKAMNRLNAMAANGAPAPSALSDCRPHTLAVTGQAPQPPAFPSQIQAVSATAAL